MFKQHRSSKTQGSSTPSTATQQNLLTEAHTWIGLLISSVLFIVFFAGTLSFYRTAIDLWETAPHQAEIANPKLAMEPIVEQILQQMGDDKLHHEHGIMIQLPKADHPNFWAFYEVELAQDSPAEQEHPPTENRVHYFSAADGQLLGNQDGFTLDTFIYSLHYWLHIPHAGRYLVGVVTLFYFVALLSGLCIHWRKLVPNFFLFRKDKPRQRWLDSHNVIGVMTFPYHLMYAITGLIFNLIIVFQAAYVALLYQGDQSALLQDAGFNFVTEEASHNPMKIDGLDALIERGRDEFNDYKPAYATVYFPGHDNALVQLMGEQGDHLGNRSQVRYSLATGEIIYRSENSEDSAVGRGLQVAEQIHFGHFGSDDFAALLKFLFFVMGLGGCYLILSGNLLWLDKRAAKRRQSKLGLHLVRAMSNGAFIGTIAATGAAFVAARLLAPDLEDRSEWVATSFFVTLLASFIYALCDFNWHRVMTRLLWLSAALWLSTPLIDWVVFASQIQAALKAGHWSVVGIQVMLAGFGLLWLALARRYRSPHISHSKAQINNPSPSRVEISS